MEDPWVVTAAPPVNKFSALAEPQSSSAFFERFVIIIEFRALATNESWFDSRQG